MIGIFIHKQDAARRITIDAVDASAITGAFSAILFSYFSGSPRADWRRATAAEVAPPPRRMTKAGRDKDDRDTTPFEAEPEGDDARDTRHYPSVEGGAS